MVLAYILLGTVATLLGLLAASALLYMYWIEIVLLCQTYRSKNETLGGKVSPTCNLTHSPRLGLVLHLNATTTHQCHLLGVILERISGGGRLGGRSSGNECFLVVSHASSFWRFSSKSGSLPVGKGVETFIFHFSFQESCR